MKSEFCISGKRFSRGVYPAFLREESEGMHGGLIQTNIKAYHIGHNGFGGTFKDVVGVVVNSNNYAMVIARVFFYLHQVAGENA